jgi:uncharacterized lipoprotein YmbA
MDVIATQPSKMPQWHLFTDIETFEAQADGRVRLTARWSIQDARGRDFLSERTSISQAPSGTGDSVLVAAMTRSINALADAIAGATQSVRTPSRE